MISLETSPSPFYNFIKMIALQYLAIFFHLLFLNTLIPLFKKNNKQNKTKQNNLKYWNHDIIGYWVIGTDWKFQNTPKKYCPWLYLLFCQVLGLIESWFKRYIKKCTLYHALILNVYKLLKMQILENTKTWIPWEPIIIFLQNKKILTLKIREVIVL